MRNGLLVSVTVGYTFLYWTDVVRPGNQIDRVVNQSTVPTVEQYMPGGDRK